MILKKPPQKEFRMKVALYRKTRYGKYYIANYKSNIEYDMISALHEATQFDTVTQKDEIDYLKNTFGFDFKVEKIEQSKALNRVYI